MLESSKIYSFILAVLSDFSPQGSPITILEDSNLLKNKDCIWAKMQELDTFSLILKMIFTSSTE
jgi:hypothetical protein